MSAVSHSLPPEQVVLQRFRKALASYDHYALVQRESARYLAQLIRTYTPPSPHVLEIGCGTGYLTRLLLSSLLPTRLIANDLIPEVHSYLPDHPSLEFLPGNAEELDYPSHLDVVTGGGVLQWIHKVARVCKKAYHALRPGGLIAFSIFGPLTMLEVSLLTGVSLPFRSLSWYVHTLRRTGFLPLWAEEKVYRLQFSNAREALYHIKHTGTHGLGHTWKGSIRDLLARYEDMWRSGTHVPLTYQVFWVIGRKR
ncbi:methyltransferase domain-containing protein [Spirochaeta thermophila]|uniref:Putative biotin biosynthesis protein BioC n=1 Tax=Winmispira thermophila (strain ATCC 49972 / DSM 6192 / RI 19.B1) TaxID=665571 RepID=E0RU48_WINT6|nr:methyltransferase domain-containing protein [Spirochaeta thermophila]ADN02269.1 putative biotin biosynthesis protein BioC [Spirochaeta thermophila DSM 6192]